MKFLLRFIKILAVVLIVVIVGLFSASFLLQDKVAGIIIKSLNKNIQTKFEFADARLSFIRSFPKASLELKDVVVHSSQGFSSASFGNINTDTLLSARAVSAAFTITDIIHGIYNIDKLGIKEGRLNIFTDGTGLVNYEISAKSSDSSQNDLTINLDRINVSQVKVTYNNLATRLLIKGLLETGKMKSIISGGNIDFTATGDLQIGKFRLYDFEIAQRFVTSVEIALQSSARGILLRKGALKVDDINFSISGFIAGDDNIDLALEGKNIDISGIKKYLPESYNKKLAEYDPSGVLNINSTFRGLLTRTRNPHINVSFDLAKGHVSYLNSALNINDLSFSGSFSNGLEMNPRTSSLAFDDIKCMLGSANYSGSVYLNNFDTLITDIAIKGRLIPSEIKEFFSLKQISAARGNADFDFKIKGKVLPYQHISVSDILGASPVANLSFSSFAIGFNNNKILINDVNGDLHVSDTVFARNLDFRWRGAHLKVNGTFNNLPEWLAGFPVVLTAKASISSSNIKPVELFPSLADTTPSSSAWMLPRDIVLDLDYRFDSLQYKTFKADNITGSLNYKPGIINFKSLNLKSMDGSISGNGFILQNRDKSFISRGSFALDKININESFRVFHNFGQDFIRAGNLSGSLSGNLSVLIPADSLFRPVIKSISAEGKYTISNGALIDFKPIQELSDFIELSELKNIHFQTLENDFFIRNNIVYTPLMDVKSSAANLSVSGKHSFDNDYEYHIRAVLSEILSKKIHKPKPNTTEFGAVKDDGLGRISVMMKIVSIDHGNDFKVSYDMKAAGNQVKNDIKNERQTLKGILKQEYGWFKKDTVAVPQQKASAPWGKIVWGDADTAKVQEEAPAPEKDPLRKLFRKK